jgi:hypothetical protein
VFQNLQIFVKVGAEIGILKTGAENSSKLLTLSSKLHICLSQKTIALIFTAVRNSGLVADLARIRDGFLYIRLG